MPWLLLRRVAVAVRNCYQFGGDTVKGKIGRDACAGYNGDSGVGCRIAKGKLI